MKNNPLTILLYHGVSVHKSIGIENYASKHIDLDSFVSQMNFVKKNSNVISIDEVVDIYNNNGFFPKNAVVVTFDDGFENNSTVAAPVLDDLKIPAIFYITAGIVNTNIMFWVDQLEDVINFTKSKNISLNLEKKVSFSLSSKKEKLNSLHQIKSFCKLSTKTKKDQILSELISACSFEPNVNHSPNYNKINWKQLIEMDQNPLFTIGGHSLYHDILSSLSVKKMHQDVKMSIELLEYKLNHKVEHYSYPEGQNEHFNDEIIDFLMKNGVKSSPSAIHGVNYLHDTNLFNLKRIMVGLSGTPFPLIK